MTRGPYRHVHAARDRAQAAAEDVTLPAHVRDAQRTLVGTYQIELANVETRRIARAIVVEHERQTRRAEP
jgi:hypothetical protein